MTQSSAVSKIASLKLPVFSWVPSYDRGFLRGDVVAGLTVWAVLVPEALAYATIAGVSPVVGLYAAPGALILYAAFGSSRHLVTGPMAATAALSAAAVGNLVAAGATSFLALTTTLALVTGALALLAGLLRLGFLASFISEPVLKGFIIGLALTIMVGQLPKLFGVEKGSGDFFEQLWHLVKSLGGTSGLTLAVGLASLAVVLGLRRFAPVVPGSLVAVLLGIAAVHIFSLRAARRRHRRPDPERAALVRVPRRPDAPLPRSLRQRRRRHARRFCGGPRCGQDLRRQESLRDRRES